jgi:hypothetical protein
MCPLGCKVTAGTWIAHNPSALTVSYKMFLYSQENIHKMFTGCRNIFVREQTIPTERPPTYIKSCWLAKALLGHSSTIWQLSDPPPLRSHNSLFEEPLFSPLAKFSVWTAVILFESVCDKAKCQHKTKAKLLLWDKHSVCHEMLTADKHEVILDYQHYKRKPVHRGKDI